jgi:ATP-dependent Lon protease
VSLVTRRKARAGIAMTGEITLRGLVFKVGGIKEKVLGAHRAGITTVILPADNESDLEDVPVEARTHMIFAPVERIEQVIQLALEAEPVDGAVLGVPAPETADHEDGGNGRSETEKPKKEKIAARPRAGE